MYLVRLSIDVRAELCHKTTHVVRRLFIRPVPVSGELRALSQSVGGL